MDFLLFLINFRLNFGKIVLVLELQLVDVLIMGVLNLLDSPHFEKFLC